MLGYGLGLRGKHYPFILENKPKVDWFEAITENYMGVGGRPRRVLRDIRKDYPLVLHGVSLCIGSKDPLNENYLKNFKELIDEIEPEWVSDHLCWGSHQKQYAHDLLPLPYTEETLSHLAERIYKVQDFIKRPLMLENVSSYLTYKSSEMTEWEFLNRLVQKTGCKLLVDINNIYVSSRNHDFDSHTFLKALPREAVGQFHLAGHSDIGHYVNDTHDEPVCNDVWDLYKYACTLFSPVPTMIERDENIPEFEEVFNELTLAKKIQEQVRNEKLQSRRSSERILEAPLQP